MWLMRHTALLGALVFVAALVGFGLAMPGYSHLDYPFDVLGAKGLPYANAFNLLGLIWPGLMAAMAMLQLRQRLPQGGWPLRIGAQLMLLSALGFVAMGLLPLDPSDLHNPASSWHATVWMLWWVAFVSGAILLGVGLRGRREWRAVGWLAIGGALVILALVLFGVAWLPSGLAQRLALLAWWGWLVIAGRTGWSRDASV